jgi:hypothetical protein
MHFTYVNANDESQIIYKSSVSCNGPEPKIEKKEKIRLFNEKLFIEYIDNRLSDVKTTKGFK